MAKAKYKNDYKPPPDQCVVVYPQTIISIGGDETFMTTSFYYHGTPVIGRAAVGFWHFDPSSLNSKNMVFDLDEFAPGGKLNKNVAISNGPWIGGPGKFPPGGVIGETAVMLSSTYQLGTKGASVSVGDWSLTSLEDAAPPTRIGYRGPPSDFYTVAYAFTRVSGNYHGNLPSEAYENRFANTVRQTGEVPTDGAAFETYLGQLGLSADANNAVSGYISSSAYSAGIAPPGGEYTAYTTDADSPLYSSSSFFSSGDVSFSFESPCARLASVNQASDINFGYYASFQGPTP